MSVYTELKQQAVESILQQYQLGQLVSYKGITAGIENTNYFLTTTAGEYVLTIFEQLTTSQASDYLTLMQHLQQNGIPCPTPQAQNNTQLLGIREEKPFAIVKKLSGQHVAQPAAQHCAQVGRLLANLHTLPYPPTPPLANRRDQTWRETIKLRVRPLLNARQQQLMQEEFEQYQRINFSELPRGIIHADLFPDNVLFTGSQLTGVLDLYDACEDTLLYDVAITLNAWCRSASGELDPHRSEAFLQHYQQQRPFTVQEQEHWPLMRRFAAMRFWLGRLNYQLQATGNALVLYKDPTSYQKILQVERAPAVNNYISNS